MSKVKCPICGKQAEIVKTENFGEHKWFICELCGYFALKSFRFKLFDFNKYKNKDKLIYALNKLSNKKNYIEINSIKELDDIIEKVEYPNTIQDKIDLILKYLYKNRKLYSRGYLISNENRMIFGIWNDGELELVMTSSEEKKYLRFDPKVDLGGGLCFLSADGINRAEKLISEFNGEQNMNNVKKKISNKCFLVHGHNDAKKLEVARFIENELNKEVIILHEQVSKGRTIIEKIEAHSEVDFAVCLYTADDIGGINKNKPKLQKRARQNVVFETGFFIGRLGRENVIILKDNDIEKPSDNDGIIYISFNNQWKDILRKEINAIYSD